MCKIYECRKRAECANKHNLRVTFTVDDIDETGSFVIKSSCGCGCEPAFEHVC